MIYQICRAEPAHHFLSFIRKLTHDNLQLREINEAVRIENHSINHRLASLERNYVRAIEVARRHVSAEISAELAVMADEVRALSRDYQENISRVEVEIVLPTTSVRAVDDLFALFAERFAEREVEFVLLVKSGVAHLAENVVGRAKLETLIGDHLQNALVAVSASEGLRSVRATIGKMGEFYELTVHDSGVPFEVDTLC